MKRSNWEGQSHSTGRWIAKLAEEVGEVGKEIADRPTMQHLPGGGKDLKAIRRTITELEHVEFIAKCFREDLERRIAQ
jgi:hypothetical protein